MSTAAGELTADQIGQCIHRMIIVNGYRCSAEELEAVKEAIVRLQRYESLLQSLPLELRNKPRPGRY